MERMCNCVYMFLEFILIVMKQTLHFI